MRQLRLFVLFAVIGAMAALSVQVTSAVSPSEQQCTAQGGDFDRQNGQVSCTVTEEGKNPKFTSEEETTGQGNIENKQEGPTQTCEPTGSGKCPPGQFNP